MDIGDLVVPSGIISPLEAGSKKKALQMLTERAGEVSQRHPRHIFDVVLERERLGTTGIGGGVAIPHGKLPDIDKIYGVFGRLETPIDFDAIDDQPVDLIFMLLAPEAAGADHLKALARVSRLLRDQAVCDKLREALEADAVYALLTHQAAQRAA